MLEFETTFTEKFSDIKKYYVHGHIFKWALDEDGEMFNKHIGERTFLVRVPNGSRDEELANAVSRVKSKYTGRESFMPLNVTMNRLLTFDKRPEKV